MTNGEIIRFSQPFVPDASVVNLHSVLASSHHCGDGKYTAYCSRLLESELNVRQVLMTSSCTHALELAGLLLGLGEGDEVLVPSFSFPSCANSFALRGAVPVFCDSGLTNPNVDANMIESRITERTKALLLVHYGGVACEMEAILETAKKYGIAVIEDLAHGPFASYKGRKLGTFGDFATLSFHHTKNFSCGEGGALIVNNRKYSERAEIIREKGTNRSLFLRGQVDKYTWVDIGSSYLPSEFQMAILAGVLDQRHEIQNRRIHIWNRYFCELFEWAVESDVELPVVPEECKHSGHVFYLRFPTLDIRTRFISYMRGNLIECPFHYQALHKSPMGSNFLSRSTPQCLNAERLSDNLVRLPLWFGLSDDDQDTVINSIKNFRFDCYA